MGASMSDLLAESGRAGRGEAPATHRARRGRRARIPPARAGGDWKRQAALAFAAAALGESERVAHRTHPDLYVLEPLGDQIRIDAIRELRRDLHMRPFEAARRVYLIFGAELMNDEAADALLKDLEEPPACARILLVADELGPISPTRSARAVQLVRSGG